MFKNAITLLAPAQHIVIIQPENPDGDSLGSSMALEELLGNQGKEVTLFCAIDIPKYLHYVNGWDRVTKEWPTNADLAIIVDTSSELLLMKALAYPGVRHFLETHPNIVFDHHAAAENDLQFQHEFVADLNAVATGEMLYHFAIDAGWAITPAAAENLLISILADSLGLTTPHTTVGSFATATELVRLGANPSEIESRRRDYMRKPAEILTYKGELISRIEYSLEQKLATVHITWDDIQTYSDRYNPSILVLDEMRLVDNVQVAVAIKTYPDGKLTGKLRTNIPVAGEIAGFFGGGGHEYSAGFKVYENYDKIMSELVTATDRAIKSYEATK